MRVWYPISVVLFALLVTACTGGQAGPTAPPVGSSSTGSIQGGTTMASPSEPGDGTALDRGGNTFGSGN